MNQTLSASGTLNSFLRTAALIVVLLSGFAACADNGASREFQGYAEGDYVYIASPYGGKLLELSVNRGDKVQAGAELFALETDVDRAARTEAEQRAGSAAARFENLRKGARPTELDSISAALDQAKSGYKLAKSEFERTEKLYADKFVSRDMLDKSKTAMESADARVAQLEAELKTAKLGARKDEIDAAYAEAESAKSRVEQIELQIGKKSGTAPGAGLVADTYYLPGEYVPPGSPVLSLLPPGNIRLKLYVPGEFLSVYAPGRVLTVACDGCPAGIEAMVNYVATEPEYTPPVIYSRNVRAKLVYLVEAKPLDSSLAAKHLHPGRPVDIRATDREVAAPSAVSLESAGDKPNVPDIGKPVEK